MSNIEQNLQKILSSRYGKDVRQSIHDSIHDCYEDGKAGTVDLVAREQIANLVANNNPTDGNSELIDIRVGADGTTYESAGKAVREQIGGTIHYKNLILLAEEYDNKLYNILDPCMAYVTDVYTDLPEGVSNGVLLNVLGNTAPTVLQLLFEFNKTNIKIYSRYANTTDHSEWQYYGDDLETSILNTLRNDTIVYDYNRLGSSLTNTLLENITWPTMFNAVNPRWTDLPKIDGTPINGILLNLKGNTNSDYLQMLIQFENNFNRIFSRVVSDNKERNTSWKPLYTGSMIKYDKKCGCLGDSITYGLKGTSWTKRIGNICGFSEVINYGVSGNTITEMRERLQDMESDLDYIVVWGGVNDFMWRNDDISTFKSYYEDLILNLINKYPASKFLAITPMKFKYTATDVSPYSRAWDIENSKNHLLLKDYVNAEIEVLEKYSIPYLNFFINSGISPDIPAQADTYFAGNGDYLHPNANGNLDILAPKIGAAINKL